MRKTRVAILTNELPPYRRPIIEQLSRDIRFDVKVFLSTEIEPGRHWNKSRVGSNLKVHISKCITLKRVRMISELGIRTTQLVHFPYSTLHDLMEFQPQVIISGEFGFRTLMAWVYKFLRRVPLIIWSEETPHTASKISLLQQMVRKFLTKRADGFIAWGILAIQYLTSLGALESQITYCAQAVDNAWWGSQCEAVDQHKVRTELGVHGKMVLYIGQLISRKGGQHLIRAWANISSEIQERNSLVIIGDGELEPHLRELANKLHCANILFIGPKPREELPKYYSAADLFVLPSILDVWGLVVNEAMACGLPVLCSLFAGCSDELIIQDVTGNTFNPFDETTLTELILRWIDPSHEVSSCDIQSHIQTWNFNSASDAISMSIETVLSSL
jgi:glycosyltransferase involved in cell wall biosynthesis